MEGDDEAREGGAGAEEEEEKGVRAVAVATDGAGPASPCGMCRQLWVFFLLRFCFCFVVLSFLLFLVRRLRGSKPTD